MKTKETKTKEVRVLLSKEEDSGRSHIATLEKNAMDTTNQIQFFNDINLLNPITTEGQVLKFLKDPVAFFENALMTDIKFIADPQPPPKGIAQMYGFDYAGIVANINACRFRNLENMVWDEKNLSVKFDEKCTKEIMESFYDYTKSEDEAREVLKDRELCKLLNARSERYNIMPSDLNLVAERLGLKCKLKEGGRDGWEFKEDIAWLRAKLEYESIHRLDGKAV